jgi:hypothetical protein
MESIRLFMCALLLSPAVALAQAEEPEGTAEEPAVEEAPAEGTESAPAEAAPEAAPEEGMSADDAAAAQQSAGEEAAEPAGPRGGHQIDVFYIPTSVVDLQSGFTSGDERGDGAGARGLYRIGHRFAVAGEYQTQKFGEDDEVELKQTRMAVGFVGDDEEEFFGLFLERDALDFGDFGDFDGYSIHGRLSGMRTGWLGFYGDLGYLRLESDAEKYSGEELTVGVLFKIGQFGVFADARHTNLEGKDSGVRAALSEVHTGVRYEFGAIKAE